MQLKYLLFILFTLERNSITKAMFLSECGQIGILVYSIPPLYGHIERCWKAGISCDVAYLNMFQVWSLGRGLSKYF